jgi:hypothetical protein
MALMVIKERSTGMYLAADFSEVAFVDAERVADENAATWLSTHFDEDLATIASVVLASDQFEVLDLSKCEDADEARARDSHWRQVDMDEIGDLMFRIVQTRKPIEVRLRDFSDDSWSQEQLVGFRLDHDGEHRVVYFVDANGREWLYCQVNRD